VIFGTAYDESLGDQLRVTVIATGLASGGRPTAPVLAHAHAPAMAAHAPHGVPSGYAPVQQSQPTQRTSTDNIPVLNAAVNVPPSGQTVGSGNDFPTLQPSVWRNNRSQAAAKVDALVSNGMEEIEIPAFLRKQAD
jgi:cell division protein FtsZ